MKKSKIPAVILAELIILILAILFSKDVTEVSKLAFLLTLPGLLILGSYLAYQKLKRVK